LCRHLEQRPCCGSAAAVQGHRAFSATAAGETTPPAAARPDSGAGAGRWQQYTDPASGKPYYFNVAAQTTQWERPPELGEADGSEQARTFTEKSVPSSPMQRVMGFAGLGQPWTLTSLSADISPNALKDTYDHSCFLAR
jgi:hypothetical protein